jgi:hypothetical protein
MVPGVIQMKFALDKDCKLKIELTDDEKQDIAWGDYGNICSQFWKMSKWFDDPNVLDTEKNKYAQHRKNIEGSVEFMRLFLGLAGLTKEIEEIDKIPF